jgi:biopolymer transport protein ExbB/TolQ
VRWATAIGLGVAVLAFAIVQLVCRAWEQERAQARSIRADLAALAGWLHELQEAHNGLAVDVETRGQKGRKRHA